MVNNNSGNKNKNVMFYRSMYIFFDTNTGPCIFFIDLFYYQYRSMYIFLTLITGQCIFF